MGLPGPIDDNESSALLIAARNRFQGLEVQAIGQLLPAQAATLLKAPEGPIPPVWFQQAVWDDRRWAARWGHHMTSLHRIVQPNERYTRFSETLLPTLSAWLEVTRDAYTFLGNAPTASTAIFAYTNLFEIGPNEPDLSEWFKFNFAVDAEGASEGLETLNVGARIHRPEHNSRVSMNLNAQGAGDAGIRVQVDTVVERDLPEGTTLADSTLLLKEIGEAKILAKQMFFSFVTDTTLQYMKAVRAPAQ